MPNITLETAIDKCKAAGLVKSQVRVIDAPADEKVADVKVSGKTPMVHGSASAGEAAKANASRGRCTRCGYDHGNRRCPALGKTCRICKGVGHFEVMCRSTPADLQVQHVYTGDTQEEMAHTDDIVYAVGPLVIEDEEKAKTRSVEQTFHIGTIECDGRCLDDRSVDKWKPYTL